MNAFDAYVSYVSIKNHFNQPKYDHFKYNGKIKANVSSFNTRSDRYQFEKLAKKGKDLPGFLVANMLENPNAWVGDLMMGSKGEEVFTDWKKRVQSLTYNFKREIENIDDLNGDLKVINGDYPNLLKFHNRKKVFIETMVVLDDILGFTKHWDKQIDDTVAWPMISLRISKYRPFLKQIGYDTLKLKGALKEHLQSRLDS